MRVCVCVYMYVFKYTSFYISLPSLTPFTPLTLLSIIRLCNWFAAALGD